MTQSFICRKRCRSDCDEESSEFTPLSKRINNLHINNTLLTATATVDNGCGANHHLLDNRNLNGMCPHTVGINNGLCSTGVHDPNQWNGVLVSAQQLSVVGEESAAVAVTQFAAQPPDVLLQSQYSPDLSPSENPYYYENNRLLFNLYLERLQRANCNYVVN